MSVLGTFNQAASAFQNAGKQCTCNSLSAIVYNDEIKPVGEWTSQDIDEILFHGDSLYSTIYKTNNDQYPLLTSFPTLCDICGFNIELRIGESYYGLVNGNMNAPPYFDFKTALSNISQYAILTIGPRTPSYSSSVIKHQNEYYIFDPHSRGSGGMPCANGSAVLTRHSSADAVREYASRLSSSLSMPLPQFEITPVLIMQYNKHLKTNELDILAPNDNIVGSQSSDYDDMPLASIINTWHTKRQTTPPLSDSGSDDNMPLAQVKRKASFRTKHKILNNDVNIADASCSSDDDFLLDCYSELTSYDNDPDYTPSPVRAQLSPGSICNEEEQTMSENIPPSTSPLKYMQVSVDAMKVLDHNEAVDFGLFDDMGPDNIVQNEETMSNRSTVHQIEVLDRVCPPCSLLSPDQTVQNPISAADDSTAETETSFMSATSEPSVLASPENVTTTRGRKRRRDSSNWKDTKRKRGLNLGEGYTTRKDKKVSRKEMKKGCSMKCRMKCHDRISQDKREAVFHMFWQTGDIDKRRSYVCSNIYQFDKKTGYDVSRRQKSFKYQLEIHGDKHSVCKTFFLDTLSISEQVVYTALNKRNEGGHVRPDMRGRHSKLTKAMEDEHHHVRQHITSFPTVESHYCRKDSQRKYLGATLNLAKLYSLYVEKRKSEGAKPVCSTTYCEIFRTQFNLGFHNPSKDRCDFCVAFENLSPAEKIEQQEGYDLHHKNKMLVRERLTRDKEESRKDEKKITLCFDLQEVLMTPHSNASILFYKRKLNTYNLSIFDLGSGKAICNIWHEGIAARGSNEIGSCVYKCLKNASEKGVTHVKLYSDSCGGQNRNKYFLTMLWFAMRKFGFTEIEHSFFIKGHSKNENDSVHATIERVSRHVDVYTTPHWAGIVSAAKQSRPQYLVNEPDETQFFDFKDVSSNLKNFDLDSDRQKVKWLHIRSMKLTSDDPDSVQILYNFEGEYHHLNMSQRIRKVTQKLDFNTIKLRVLNKGKGPGIDVDKYNDLQSLCRGLIIPKSHHQFFNLLKIKSNEIDD